MKKSVQETTFLQKVGFPKIDFELEMPEGPVLAVFDERLLSQALINVIKNAAEAIEAVEDEQKGKISVKVSIIGENAIIDITDNGKGLPKTDRQKLLEPYMTTREKGTGLGLAIVRKILDDHDGRIELMDSPEVVKGGRGALMRLVLPVAQQQKSKAEKVLEAEDAD